MCKCNHCDNEATIHDDVHYGNDYVDHLCVECNDLFESMNVEFKQEIEHREEI